MLRISCLIAFTLLLHVAVADEPATAPKVDASVDASQLTVDRIYVGKEFDGKSFNGRWLDGQSAYVTLESSENANGGKDIVRHDAATGETTVMVAATDLTPPGEDSPLKIESYQWSKDHNLLLVFTNSKRVWRNNTRGDYWLLDRSSRQLRKIGGDAPPASLMFAKLAPTGKNIAYVRDRNLYVEDLFDHTIRQLTQSESEDVINGTTDWVYEEELGLRDAFRWSPDGQWIAYWQINTEGVEKFPLVNNTDSLYPTVKWFAYPKVGQRNPSCRIGMIHCESAEMRWIELPGDPRDHYVPRIEFLPSAEDVIDDRPRLLIQQLNRLQNTNRLFLADFRSATVSAVMTEKDEAWVDVHDELKWIDSAKRFTWISDRDGWRHIYIASLDGGEPVLVTQGDFDVIELLQVDEKEGDQKGSGIYFIASPDSASERYLYRVGLDGSDLKRITPAGFIGTHSYRISADANWAIHTRSSSDLPPVTDLVSLDDHRVVRVLENNEELLAKVEQLSRSPTEFFRVEIGDDVQLDAWCIKPPNLDPAKKYPLLCYVYGEPAGSTVVNRWGGKSYLWHLMLAQRGYVVMSFDNRGTKAPRGRAFRKSIYKQIGILPPQDQAAAVKAVLASRSYLDPNRVGVWGWSGGGSSSLHAIFKYPDLYATAIAVAPVPNQRYYDTIYQERYMSLPELNVEGFREGSPINFAKNLQGNLLLVHGTGDDNCHYQTTEMLIDELVANNKQFSLMVYPNRTHSIRERKNTTRHLREMMTQFLLQNLPPGDASSP
jgi:dipeptidyl-peptidase-4